MAQGRTVDTAHVLVTDTLSRQSFYVGMSRGRESNIAHVVTGETAPQGAEPYQQATAEAVIHQVMERDSRRAVRDRADPGQPGMGIRDRARAQPVDGGDPGDIQSRG